MLEATYPISKKWFRNYVIVMITAISILLVFLFAPEPADTDQDTAKAEEIQANAVTTAISAKTGLKETAGEALEMTSGADTFSQDGVYWIQDSRQQGKGGFKCFFTTVPEYGKELNVRIKNNGRSGTFIVNVIRGSQEYGYVDVKAGQTILRTFHMADGSGVTGDWKVYLTTQDGHETDSTIAAEQH